MLTNEQLKAIVPQISDNALATYVPLLNNAFEKYFINTSERQRCFIAETAHESDSFNAVKEYGTGKEYEGRQDLGNTEPGDGVKFKGRGLIQVTGKRNYELCSLFIFGDRRLLEEPDTLEQPEYALESACWYWTRNQLNEICDKDDLWVHVWKNRPYNRFEWLTVKINGGLNGYASRLSFYNRAKEVLV